MLLAAIAVLGCSARAPQPGAAARDPAPAPPAAASPSVVVDADADGDGIVDRLDRCPDEPEDRDEFEDGDGCVDRDNDGDRILDAYEWKDGGWTNCDYKTVNGKIVDCRLVAEDYDGVEDADGCPDMICLDQMQLYYGDIRYERGGRLAPDAAARLDEIAEILRLMPDIEFWLEAHIDRQRDPAVAKRLTERIAGLVRDELVRRGIAPGRLHPIAWGDLKPLTPNSNKSAEGRAANRRVNFVISNWCSCGVCPREGEEPQPGGNCPAPS